MAVQGQEREQTRLSTAAPLAVDEAESGPAASNNTVGTAERISTLGTGVNDVPAAEVTGTLGATELPPVAIPAPAEDNGSIPLAGDLKLSGNTTTVVSGQIGDGPHGTGRDGMAHDGTGDFDFYRIDGTAGELISLDIDTAGDGLDSVLVLWAQDGRSIKGNDDFGGSRDSLAIYELPVDGPFYVSVGGFPDTMPYDPFDSATGFGGGSEGDYVLTASTVSDVDTYAIDVEAGDVIGASVTGAAGQLELLDQSGTLLGRSAQDVSAIYPAASPLPGGGNAVLAQVADRRGWFYVRVLGGQGDYRLTLEIYRAGGQTTQRTQTFFLDFNGECVDSGLFGGLGGERSLSPLRTFLPKWGLHASDERALISSIITAFAENVKSDPRNANPLLQVRVLNSRDNKDPIGQPGVSRVVIGGTAPELGVMTIGAAESVDPGNFATDESAVVLLDGLSEAAGAGWELGPSLNNYLVPGSQRISFIGQAIGNVASHEAGHLIGSFHTDQSNGAANLMDNGGNSPLMFGVGIDGKGGTADDVDVDFGKDIYSPSEGLGGLQDTRSVTAFGLTGG